MTAVMSIEQTLRDRYAAARGRLWPINRVMVRPEPKPAKVSGLRLVQPAPVEAKAPIIIKEAPEPKQAVVLPWPCPQWRRQALSFNQHVIDWLRYKLAEENGVEPKRFGGRSMRQITNEVLASFPQITLADLKSEKRFRVIVAARQTAMYYIYRERVDVSLPELGRFFGGRDHSTVHHAIRKMELIYGKARGG
jgi:hypothetical protein